MSLAKKVITTGGALIALYLGVYYWTGSGTLIKTGSSGAATVIKAFQGRT